MLSAMLPSNSSTSWQVAEPGPAGLVPEEQVGAVQATLAGLGRPYADQQAGEGGFARGGRADDAQEGPVQG
jgi:hypothetical protein